MTPTVDLTTLTDLVGAVEDPEIPALTISDLGVLRSVVVEGDTVVVTITPTYSGCPAMEYIVDRIDDVLSGAGVHGEVRTVMHPAWTTDWMTAEGRAKLRDAGIAPPRGVVAAEPGVTPVSIKGRPVPCPLCGSTDTETVSTFGSTACKALMRCTACLEPFDHFKEI